MKLDKTLNFKKVRCVKAYDDCLTVGKEYSVLDIRTEVKVKDDEGAFLYWESDHFEPVLADNSVNIQDIDTNILDTNADIKDTPKFKVGNKVYFGANPDIKTISEIGNDNDVQFVGELGWASGDCCCHAAQENYERLQATFPGIEFERPPLTGNELCRKLLDKGEKYIMANDEHGTWLIICDYCDDWFTDVVTGKCLKNITPLNSKGEPLTQAVLDEN